MIDRRFVLFLGIHILLMLLFLVAPFPNVLLMVIREVPLKDLLSSDVISAAGISVLAATITIILVASFGIPLAFFLARVDFRGKELLSTLITLPLVTPPVVAGILLLSIYGERGVVGRITSLIGFRFSGTLLGIIIAQTFVASPYLILAAWSAFEQVDPNLEKASLLLGKGSLETFFRISLPLSIKGITAGLIMSWARAIGEFGATMVMAYYPRSLPVKIWIDLTGKGLKATLPNVFILMIFVILIVLASLYTKSTSTFSLFMPRSRR